MDVFKICRIKIFFYILLALSPYFCWAQKNNILPYQNSKLSIEERVIDLLGRMTLEEKIAQTLSISAYQPEKLLDEKGDFSTEKAAEYFPNGLGAIYRPSDILQKASSPYRNAMATANATNTIQQYFIEQTRLGIPVILQEECIKGQVVHGSTNFPTPIALASSWDIDLVQRVYEVTSKEARLSGIHQAFGPTLDVASDPRWGGFEKTFGEDPILIAELGKAAVKGLQGTSPTIDEEHMVATLLHVAGDVQPESGNQGAPSYLPERTLRETVLLPFQKVLQETNVKSIAVAANEIDGIPSHTSSFLLNDLLKTTWGFNGFTISAENGISELISQHQITQDSTEAALMAFTAGVDIELSDDHLFLKLVQTFENQQIEESLLDSTVSRLLHVKFALGLFDRPYSQPNDAAKFIRNEKNREVALEAAQKSIVLLQNDNSFLPLDAKAYKTIALIGPYANNFLSEKGQTAELNTSLIAGIKNHVEENISVVHAEGCRITESNQVSIDSPVLTNATEDNKRISHAVKVAERSDLIILALGDYPAVTKREGSRSYTNDRANIQLPGRQKALLKQIAATNKPIVLVLFNGRPLATDEAIEHVDAILACWQLGQAYGSAIADILFGKVNPSGKLPCTIPRSVGHLPAYYNHRPSARKGYMLDENKPLFPFGFGLSFTSFTYSDLEVYPKRIPIGGRAEVTVTITNTGKFRGEEVVQLYIHDKVGSVTRPVKTLKGFQKVDLKPGQSREVKFILKPDDLKLWNRNMEFVVEPGFFDVMVGSSSESYDTVLLEVVK